MHGEKVKYLNRQCYSAFISLIQEGACFPLLKFVKRGLIDINFILINDMKKQCVLLSVLTGMIFEENHEDITLFYQYIKDNFNQTSQVKAELLRKYTIDEDKCTGNLSYLLEYLSTAIKRRICVFSFREGLNTNYHTTYITKRSGYSKSIKIVIWENHSYFLFTNKNIEHADTEFCTYCCKSYSNLKLHKCIIEKCPSCFRYLKNYKSIKSGISIFCSLDPNFKSEACTECKKKSKNLECFKIHKSLPKSYCKATLFCTRCNRLHQDKQHSCNLPFCRKCYSNHVDTMFCKLNIKNRKIYSNRLFLVHYESTSNNFESLNLLQLNLNNSNSEYEIYSFLNNEKKFYIRKFHHGIEISKSEMHYKKDVSFTLSDIISTFCDCIQHCKCHFQVIASKISFRQIINKEKNIASFKIFQKNNEICKIKSKSLTIISSYEYFHLEEYELSLYLNLNPYIYFLDSILEEKNDNEEMGTLTLNYFLDKVHLSDQSMVQVLKNHSNYLVQIEKETKRMVVEKKSFQIIFVLLSSIQSLHKIYCRIFSVHNVEAHFLNSESMIDLFYKQFLQSIEKTNLPVLPSFKSGNLKNTSRHELFLSEIVVFSHLNRFPNHKVFSLVNGSGEQKTIGKLSTDIFCEQCNVAIFVEGYFKFICENHLEKNISERKKRLDKLGKSKRSKFCDLSKVGKCFVLGTCCIEDGLYSQDFKESLFYDDQLLEKPLKKIQKYPFSFYQKLNFQEAILPPISFPLVKGFKCLKENILKFDIESAFISVFENPDFLLPCSNEAIRLVGKSAQEYYLKSNLENKFLIIRAFILPNPNLDFQIIPIKLKDKSSTFKYYCRTCSEKSVKTEIHKCNHSKFEKGVYITCYGFDFKFIQMLKYYFEICEIIIFPGKHNTVMQTIAQSFKRNKRESTCKLEKTLIKKAALSSLGRFALNVENYDNIEEKFSISASEIGFLMQSKSVKSFHIFDHNILWAIHGEKVNNFNKYQKSCLRNTCSVLFGAANNYIRNTMIQTYLFSKTNLTKHSQILRFSVDCFFIYLSCAKDKIKMNGILKKSIFNFKLEEKIKVLYNHKQSGYITKDNKERVVLKIPGVSLSLYQRQKIKVEFDEILKKKNFQLIVINKNYMNFS